MRRARPRELWRSPEPVLPAGSHPPPQGSRPRDARQAARAGRACTFHTIFPTKNSHVTFLPYFFNFYELGKGCCFGNCSK